MLLAKLSRYDFAQWEFGRNVTFKLYDEAEAAYNCTGYTFEMKFLSDGLAQILNDIAVSWTTQSSGIGTFAFTNTDKPSVTGYAYIQFVGTKSGEQIASHPVRVYVSPGADA